jgi:hypothetical protein
MIQDHRTGLDLQHTVEVCALKEPNEALMIVKANETIIFNEGNGRCGLVYQDHNQRASDL